MGYLCDTLYVIVPLAVAQESKAVWHLNTREASVKRTFLYKHLRDFFFFSSIFLQPCWWVEKGDYYVKGALGSAAHLPAMLPCSFEDHLSVASLKCFYKGEQWTLHRNCPWNKSEHSQDTCSFLPGQWARRRSSEKSITGDQTLLTVEDILQRKEKSYTHSSFCSPESGFIFAVP